MRFFRYPSIWIGLLLLVQAARAQVPTNLGGWQPNGTVLNITEDDDHFYLGGEFTQLVKPGEKGGVHIGWLG